jgi:hypothetical protein
MHKTITTNYYLFIRLGALATILITVIQHRLQSEQNVEPVERYLNSRRIPGKRLLLAM